MLRFLSRCALVLLLTASTTLARDFDFHAEELPGLSEQDFMSQMGERSSSTTYASYLRGLKVVPARHTPARGVFLAQPDRHGEELHFGLWVALIKNPVEATIRLGGPDENGPVVATIFEDHPGNGRRFGHIARGSLDAHDLEGPLAGESLIALLAALESGQAYLEIATDDGHPGENTGPGDFASGEIRGPAIRFGSPFPLPIAHLQVIHNAADPLAAEVDIYLGSTRIVDDFGFRTATPFVELPAEVPLAIGVAPGNSESAGDVLATFPVKLDEDGQYIAIANGVLNPAAFAANPNERETVFTLFLQAMARKEATDPNAVEFFGVHGATDAPTVDIIARDVATLLPDVSYGDVSGYLPVPPAEYVLDVTPGDDNDTIVASFVADLSGLAGGAAAVFASGFLDPSANQNGAAFGLFAALPNGAVVEFPAFERRPQAQTWVDLGGHGNGGSTLGLRGAPLQFEVGRNWPNPVRSATNIAFALPQRSQVGVSIYDVSGRMVQQVAPRSFDAGRHELTLDASRLSSGVYWMRVQANGEVRTNKMIVTR